MRAPRERTPPAPSQATQTTALRLFRSRSFYLPLSVGSHVAFCQKSTTHTHTRFALAIQKKWRFGFVKSFVRRLAQNRSSCSFPQSSISSYSTCRA